MTKKNDTLHCDTDGCNKTTPLEGQAKDKTWYFDFHDGKFLDYCPKHHQTIRQDHGNA